ncbi:hypothetical protein BDV29DRAFT_183766 [Aspergillus leporis]|uniref:Uncharacterized protein n=1 Tax=Aspergillus leporis TaxID=41062 RepID=A0A5N5WPD5_9EURO|nr:hypothetical protein BDV29DRAFT_183766 [Aspergillus leporis]
MPALYDIPLTRHLETSANIICSMNCRSPIMHDPECAASPGQEKTLPVPLSHYDHSFILPPLIDCDWVRNSSRGPSTYWNRTPSWKSPGLSRNRHEWGTHKGLDKDALSSLQEYCSSFDEVRLLKRGLQRLE